MVLKGLPRDVHAPYWSISQKPSQKGTGSRLWLRRATGSADLAWLLEVSALSPNPMQGREMLKKPPRVRDNNGALQVRLRLGGRDHFINRIGRFDDPVAQARGQAICAEIWLDAQKGDLDLSLNRYRPLVEGLESARCPEVTGRREEVGKGESCLSGGEEFLVANQDNCFLIGFLLG